MKLFQYWLIVVTLSLVTASTCSASACLTQESSEHGVMGTVLKFPQDNSYRIERNGEIEHLSATLSSYLLYAGDKISVLEDNEVLWFNLGGSKSIGVTKQNSPYVVEKLETATIFGNFICWLRGISEKLDSPTKQTVVIRGDQNVFVKNPSESKSEPLQLNVLSSNPSYLVEGERPLYLSWRGGKEPYAIHIIKITGDCKKTIQLLPVSPITKLFLKTDAILFEVGDDYEVHVVDGDGYGSIGRFRVVGKNNIPLGESVATEVQKLTTDISSVILAVGMELDVINAKSLGDNEKMSWFFETYQQVSAIATKQPGVHFIQEVQRRLEQR